VQIAGEVYPWCLGMGERKDPGQGRKRKIEQPKRKDKAEGGD
jgi:hypothetical protein